MAQYCAAAQAPLGHAALRTWLALAREGDLARLHRAGRSLQCSPHDIVRSWLHLDTASKTLHLVVRPLDHKGLGQARWVTRWKPALNAFAITFADRMPAAENM